MDDDRDDPSFPEGKKSFGQEVLLGCGTAVDVSLNATL